jgi:hypothetical protein
MGMIHRAIFTRIVGRAAFLNKRAKTGAVTIIQRFGSALNLNKHLRMFLCGLPLSTTKFFPKGGNANLRTSSN